MVRSSCCWRVGLKKGPWSVEEDQILVSFVRKHGHPNWRALPKLAGLLRCGKSCRLRWTNYLRPDIRRGNFSSEEEETIIRLHETLGNRWSAIAAKLPGRTDNEIKNVWHTYLKKRLKQKTNPQPDPCDQSIPTSLLVSDAASQTKLKDSTSSQAPRFENLEVSLPMSPSISSGEISCTKELNDSTSYGIDDKKNDEVPQLLFPLITTCSDMELWTNEDVDFGYGEEQQLHKCQFSMTNSLELRSFDDNTISCTKKLENTNFSTDQNPTESIGSVQGDTDHRRFWPDLNSAGYPSSLPLLNGTTNFSIDDKKNDKALQVPFSSETTASFMEFWTHEAVAFRNGKEQQHLHQCQFSRAKTLEPCSGDDNWIFDETMGFWYDLFLRAGDSEELLPRIFN